LRDSVPDPFVSNWANTDASALTVASDGFSFSVIDRRRGEAVAEEEATPPGLTGLTCVSSAAVDW
jgi:hypothetical protein